MNRTAEGTNSPALLGTSVPPITVGLPVYNGEPYLQIALDSVLAQQDVDFQLRIADNCSTDGTEEICRQAAKHDKRIHYFKRPRNIGPNKNHNFLVHESKTRYFAWAAADDAYAPQRLSRMFEALRNDPRAVLSFTAAKEINSRGEITGNWHNPCRTDHPDPIVRLRDLIGIYHENYHFYGLYDRAALISSGLLPEIKNSDRVLMAKMALRGRFLNIDEELFLHRQHDGRLTQSVTTREWYRTQRTDQKSIVLPNVEEAGWYLKAVMNAPLTTEQKVRALAALKPWLRENAIPMARNVARAVIDGTRSLVTAG